GQLSPLGNLLAMGASLRDADGVLAGVGAAARTVLDQPFITGTSSFLEAAQDPEANLGRFVSSSVSSFVPTFVADIAAITDSNEGRDTKGHLLDPFKARVPGLRGTLPKKRDVFG